MGCRLVVTVVILGSVLSLVLVLVGLRDLASVANRRRRLLASAAGVHDSGEQPLVERLDRSLRGTRLGRWLEEELQLAGLDRRPVIVLGVGLAVAVTSVYLLWTLLAPLLGGLGLAVGVVAVRGYLRRGRERRREAFIAQLPELARVLANATYAGLSLPTSLALAGDELDEPARTELKRVSTAVNFGSSLSLALDDLRQRIDSREVSVLVSTLVVAARSGGSLVTSLRDIAETLDERKETRREIRTILSQSVATAYMVIALGFGMLLLLNVTQPGTVETMTREPLGQLALLSASVLFVAGFFAIRRMTRIDV